MKRFLLTILYFMLPLFILLMVYVISDPFMVIRTYSDYFPKNSKKECVNDAYRGIKIMDITGLPYNSFIVGSSRSDFYYIDDWKEYIGDSSICIHFNQSGDNLLGSVQRIKYLYKRFDRVNNLLWIVDSDYLAGITPNKGHLFQAPYQVTDNIDFIHFHYEFLKTFYTKEFLSDYLFSKSTSISTALPYFYISQYNELHKYGADSLMKHNLKAYYDILPQTYQLYSRDTTSHIASQVIKDPQLKMLSEVHQLIKDANTNVKIIVSPLYNQIQLNELDKMLLDSIFGQENVFDFSGINQYTNNSLNYYENSHYRPQLCRELLNIVYEQDGK